MGEKTSPSSDWIGKLPWQEIVKAAGVANTDPYYLAATVWKESRGNPWAQRYEPGYKWLYKHRQIAELLEPRISVETMEVAQKTSYGLCQVMGAVAYENGFRGYPGELFEIQRNLLLGATIIGHLEKRYGDWEEVAAVYNGGTGALHRNAAGMFPNQRYVDDVLRYYREIHPDFDF